MITQLAHVCIGAKDLDEALRFYCDGLGMTKTFDFIKDGELFGFYLAAGQNTFIEIFQERSDLAAGKSLVQHFCLEVDDINGMGQHMIAQGWDVTEKTMGADNTWQVWLTDPSGIRLELHQYTDKSSQYTGEACQVNW